jgi:molecular chaperone DnaK
LTLTRAKLEGLLETFI